MSIYVKEKGLRFVKTYSHDFISFAKKRWIGQSLIDIYCKEFKAYSNQYYEEAIQSGRITVNDCKANLQYKIRNQDKIVHKVIRQENPVLD